MALSSAAANGLALLLFQATAFSSFASNHPTPTASLVCALHTADPTSVGNQSSSEATYTGYARVSVIRTSGGWAVANNSVGPVASISFASASAGNNTITHFSLSASTGANAVLLMSGTVTPNIVVSAGVTPYLTTATQITFT